MVAHVFGKIHYPAVEPGQTRTTVVIRLTGAVEWLPGVAGEAAGEAAGEVAAAAGPLECPPSAAARSAVVKVPGLPAAREPAGPVAVASTKLT